MVRAEFFIEPFVEGQPGPHVDAALNVLRSQGLEVEIGPFGSVTTGELTSLIAALAAAQVAAMDAGATRFTVNLSK